jgi:hypothetical protein
VSAKTASVGLRERAVVLDACVADSRAEPADGGEGTLPVVVLVVRSKLTLERISSERRHRSAGPLRPATKGVRELLRELYLHPNHAIMLPQNAIMTSATSSALRLAALAGQFAAQRQYSDLEPLIGADHMHHRVDERQVGEGLREVAEMTAGARIDLLGIEPERARV